MKTSIKELENGKIELQMQFFYADIEDSCTLTEMHDNIDKARRYFVSSANFLLRFKIEAFENEVKKDFVSERYFNAWKNSFEEFKKIKNYNEYSFAEDVLKNQVVFSWYPQKKELADSITALARQLMATIVKISNEQDKNKVA